MSTPFSCRSFENQALSFAKSHSPSREIPTLVTVSSCTCSASGSRKSGSLSSTRFKSKAPTFMISPRSTCEFWHLRMGACLFRSRIRLSTSATSSSLTKSILFRIILSANKTCSTASFSAPSGFSSSRCWIRCLASTTVRMASSFMLACICSSTKKVCATGAGSAIPVVSMSTPSNLLGRDRSLLRIRMRSPRTVQQIHPLFISKISSSALIVELTSESSMPISPNSFSITAIFLPCDPLRMLFIRVVLPDPKNPVSTVTGILPAAPSEAPPSAAAALACPSSRVALRTAWSLGKERVGKGAAASKPLLPSLSEPIAFGTNAPFLNRMKSFGLRSVRGEVSLSASLMALLSCG
mmetsp:Transcript_12901/g.27195  ORF Transcript_12901/g.27195 Transcript_12901/m.27195 type:complete len:353 (-) Transcript_12901:291-1349(-)